MPLQPTDILDLRGLKCPLPVLKTQKRMKSMNSGEVIVVNTTDPMADLDFTHYCKEHGHKILEKSDSKNYQTFKIQKK